MDFVYNAQAVGAPAAELPDIDCQEVPCFRTEASYLQHLWAATGLSPQKFVIPDANSTDFNRIGSALQNGVLEAFVIDELGDEVLRFSEKGADAASRALTSGEPLERKFVFAFT